MDDIEYRNGIIAYKVYNNKNDILKKGDWMLYVIFY